MSKRKGSSPFLQAYMASLEDLSVAMPNFMGLVQSGDCIVSGLSLFLGDSNEWVGCVRRFSEDGAAEIIWSSGNDVIACLMNLDQAVASGKFRPDKKWKSKTG